MDCSGGQKSNSRLTETTDDIRLTHPAAMTPTAPKGHPRTIFKHSTVDVKFICTICCWVLRHPVQSICGHRFCKDCIEYTFKNIKDPTCALCVEERSQNVEKGEEEEENESIIYLEKNKIFADNAIKREFAKLEVWCYFEGCTWKGFFKDFEEHILICVYRKVICAVCKEVVKQCELGDHEESHRKQIKGQMCIFGCQHKVETEITEHMQKYIVEHWNSLYKRVSDIQILIGQTEPQSRDQAAAQAPSTTEKLQPLIPRIQEIDSILRKLQIQVNEQKLKFETTPGVVGGAIGGAELSSASASSKANFTAQWGADKNSGAFQQNEIILKSLAEIQEKMPIFEGVITVLNREIEKLSIQSDSAAHQQKTDKELIDVLDRKVKALERQLAMKDATIAEQELRITSLELTSYDGTLVWKISEFSRRKQEAISGRTPSIYSTPFYTSKTGYKMCARIYLNGDGMGKGTHVSMFFVIMRGQYDAMLKWPFRQKVTMMFLDQHNREHVLDAFRPDPTSSSFKRPTSEMNIASGCPLFLALTQLDNPQHGYVKDNTAFLKIVVNTEEVIA